MGVVLLKDENSYRFTLKFPCETAEQIKVGEFLERLGNKKSRFIVLAMSEYINAHPELLNSSGHIKVQIEKPGIAKDDLRKIIEEMLIEKGYIPGHSSGDAQSDTADGMSAGVDDMLNNLGEFFK